MLCPQCGHEMADSAKFCPECGYQVMEVAVTQQEAVTQPIDSAATQPMPEQPVQPQPQPYGDQVYQQTTQINPDPTPVQEQPTQAYQQPQQQYQQPYQQQVYQQPMAQYPQGAYVQPQPSSGKAVGALVCGIASIVLSATFVPSIILGIVAIVLASGILKVNPAEGKAKGGKICGIIGLVLSVLILVGTLIFTMFVVSAINTADDDSEFMNMITNSIEEDLDDEDFYLYDEDDDVDLYDDDDYGYGPSYDNARYGFGLVAPEGFEIVSESANGDGATLRNSQYDIDVTVFGTNNVNGLDPEKFTETQWNGDQNAYTETDDNSVLIEQDEPDGTTSIIYAFVGKGSINQMIITYPQSLDSDVADSYVALLLLSFTHGDIATSH